VNDEEAWYMAIGILKGAKVEVDTELLGRRKLCNFLMTLYKLNLMLSWREFHGYEPE